jgi:presenilin enhancer 2
MNGDPKKQEEEEILLAQRYFYAGLFLFLPFLWLVNLGYFFHRWRDPACPAALKAYLRSSALGACIVTTVLVAWIAAFHANSSLSAFKALLVWSVET